MNLETLIHREPGGNAAFILPDSIALDGLIEQYEFIGKTGGYCFFHDIFKSIFDGA